MQRAMMFAAKRYSEFITDFSAERARLRKFQMMGITRRATADQARLCADKGKVGLVSSPHRFAKRRDRHLGRRLSGDGLRAIDPRRVVSWREIQRWVRGL